MKITSSGDANQLILCYDALMLNEHIDSFLLACRVDGLSQRTIDWYHANLSAWSRFIGSRDWHDVNLTRAFIADLQSRADRYTDHPRRKRTKGGLSTNTLRGYIRSIKRFCNWLVAEGVLPANPMERIRLPKRPARIPRGVESDDFDKMLSACLSVRDRALLLVLRDTGCRSAEVRNLRIGDVDLDRGIARVIGKGNQEGFVFLQPSTCKEIKNAIEGRSDVTDYLFVTSKGPFNRETLANTLKRIGKRAGVKGRSNPHSLRHAFARDYLLDGGDLASLADLMRHKDIQTTKMYAAFNLEHLRELHSKHSPVKD